MRKCLILIFYLTNIVVFAQGRFPSTDQWLCTEEGNPFDGYKRIAFIESISWEVYNDESSPHRMRLEVYQNKEGDAVVSITPYFGIMHIAVNGKVYCSGCGTPWGSAANRPKPPSEHIFDPINVRYDDDKMSLLSDNSGLIEDLKVSSNFQIRIEDPYDEGKIADFKFTLNGSWSAIDCALR